MRRVIAVMLLIEALLLLFVAWFASSLTSASLLDGASRLPSDEAQLRSLAALGYALLLTPVIAYAWRGALPRSRLPRGVMLAATLTVTLTQLAWPFVVEQGFEDSIVLWLFSIALGLVYMLNRDLIRPTVTEA